MKTLCDTLQTTMPEYPNYIQSSLGTLIWDCRMGLDLTREIGFGGTVT